MPVWPLTGRAEELAAVLTHARGRGIVLAGAAGVGKTRLAREALAHARRIGREARYVAATASARSVPLGAFADYVTRLAEDPLARVGEVVDAVTRTDTGTPLVVIDDAHLLDEQSALVAHHIVRRRAATAVLTVRSGEAAPDAVTALWKDQLLPRLEVQPLSRAETADLLEAVLGGPVESATAGRIWHYTRGNVLYLRQLVADELATDHLLQRSGVWIWDTVPTVSPTLAELIDANIGRHPGRVLDVLDVLAVADPLELDTLTAVTSGAAAEDAEAANLVTIDTNTAPPLARLAHPMYGEVRRTRAPALRLRRLRSAILAASPPLATRADEVQLVRRAMLLIDSDTTPDPQLLIDAADSALRLMDPATAECLARCAVQNGGGPPAQWWLMYALTNGTRVAKALAVNEDLLDTAPTDAERVHLTLARVGILMYQGSVREAAQQLEQTEDLARATGFERPFDCIAAFVQASSRPRSAAEMAVSGLTGTGSLPEDAEFTGIVALVSACSVLGRIDTIDEYVDRGYRLARAFTFAGRFVLYIHHARALCLAGFLDEAADVANRVAQEPAEFPLALSFIAFMRGYVAWSRGDLATARRYSAEAAALAEGPDLAWLRPLVQAITAVASAVAGDPGHARAAIDDMPSHDGVLTQRFQVVEHVNAWVKAADGLVGEALALAHDAARRARTAGQLALEVSYLQIAAQFGDPGGAARLAELVTMVQGPRARAAAAHTVALRDADGDGLLTAARSYEAFGDRIAAGDAAAQAAVVLRGQGRRGAAMTATAFARRLADQTGADTPALRANTTPIPLTARQREIIALAAHGVTNREIAGRLTMSVRTVENHLFRASQRTGVNSRDELIGLVSGTGSPDDHRGRRPRDDHAVVDRPSPDAP